MSWIKCSHGLQTTSKLLCKKSIFSSSVTNLFLRHNTTSAVSTSDKTDPFPLPWALSSAVCIERIPTIVPPLSELQSKMIDMLKKVELENSKLSEHELRHFDDIEKAKKIKEGIKAQKDVVLITAVDDEDKWNRELAEFAPASCNTESDKKNDLKSTDRCLNRPLYLIVKRIIGNVLHWDLPTTIRQGDESMRATAERAIVEYLGSGLQVQILGNAPWAVYKYKYPRKIQQETGKRGEKVFIFKAYYKSGVVDAQSIVSDYQWAVQEDIYEMLDKPTRTALFEILYDEEP